MCCFGVEGPECKKALQRDQGPMPLGRYGSAGVKGPDGMAVRGAVWSLQQAPVGESQRRPLGFWSKILPSCAGNCSPFEKQLLVYYCALAETECLTMGHQVTTWPYTIKLGVYSNTLLSNGRKWYICDQTQAGPEGISKLHKEMAQMPMVPTPATLPSLSQPIPMAQQEFPEISWQRKKRLGPGLQIVLHDMQATLASGQMQYCSPWGHPWRTRVKDSPCNG